MTSTCSTTSEDMLNAAFGLGNLTTHGNRAGFGRGRNRKKRNEALNAFTVQESAADHVYNWFDRAHDDLAELERLPEAPTSEPCLDDRLGGLRYPLRSPSPSIMSEASGSMISSICEPTPTPPPPVSNWPPKCEWMELPEAFKKIDPFLATEIAESRARAAVRDRLPDCLLDDDDDSLALPVRAHPYTHDVHHRDQQIATTSATTSGIQKQITMTSLKDRPSSRSPAEDVQKQITMTSLKDRPSSRSPAEDVPKQMTSVENQPVSTDGIQKQMAMTSLKDRSSSSPTTEVAHPLTEVPSFDSGLEPDTLPRRHHIDNSQSTDDSEPPMPPVAKECRDSSDDDDDSFTGGRDFGGDNAWGAAENWDVKGATDANNDEAWQVKAAENAEAQNKRRARKLALEEMMEELDAKRQELLNMGSAGAAELAELEIAQNSLRVPVEKGYYQEHPEITAMSWDEVGQFREENEIRKIRVNYINAQPGRPDRPNIKPITKFEHVWAPYPEILQQLTANPKFERPTPIQREVWPLVMSGKDCIGIAATGSGKTLAFLLPAFVHIIKQPTKRDERLGPTVLAVVNTRELAEQIGKEAELFMYQGIRSVVCVGGEDRNRQIAMLTDARDPADIVIGTPGRINDLIAGGSLAVEEISYLVIDEADEMLQKGFHVQIIGILQSTRKDRITIMTSATWPEAVRHIGESYMNDPVMVSIGSDELKVCQSVDLEVLIVDTNKKLDTTIRYLKKWGSDHKVLIFCNTKPRVEEVCKNLRASTGRRDIAMISSALEQNQRKDKIADVINYDMPSNIEDFVHRVGRSGRAGEKGYALSLLSRSDNFFNQIVGKLVHLMEKSGQSHNVNTALREAAIASGYAVAEQRERQQRNQEMYGKKKGAFNPDPYGDREWRGYGSKYDSTQYNSGNNYGMGVRNQGYNNNNNSNDDDDHNNYNDNQPTGFAAHTREVLESRNSDSDRYHRGYDYGFE